MSEIEILLSKGQNPVNAISLFNGASMRSDKLVEVIAGDSSVLKHINYQVKVAKGTAVLTIRFDGAPYSETVSAVLACEVNKTQYQPNYLISYTNFTTDPCFRQLSICSLRTHPGTELFHATWTSL